MAYLEACFKSAVLRRLVHLNVILPVEDTATLSRHPQKPAAFRTLYLLHGYTGDHSEWMRESCIARVARHHDLAVVMPDGDNSFYQDNPERDQCLATYVGEEVVGLTRRMFPLSDKREDTFIAGNSMGGFGALYLGLRYADTFGAICSLSGAFVQDRIGREEDPLRGMATPNPAYWRAIFGDESAYPGSEHDLRHLIDVAAMPKDPPRIMLCCGTEDPLYPLNEAMADRLARAGFAPKLCASSGTHDWDYWDDQVPAMIDFLLG